MDLNFTVSPGDRRQGLALSLLLKIFFGVFPIIFQPPGTFVGINIAKLFNYAY